MLNKLPRKSLADEIVVLLRKLIISGELKPGEHLRETMIAEQIATSRSPIREAFVQLEKEGLVVSVPNQGRFVRVFNSEDIKDIIGLRTAIEKLAAEILISENKLTVKDFAELDKMIQRQEDAVRRDDRDELTELDLAFHDYMCDKAGRERLSSVWQSLRRQIQVLFDRRFHNKRKNYPSGVVGDHVKILNALKSGDVDLVAKLHTEINARVTSQLLNNSDDDDEID